LYIQLIAYYPLSTGQRIEAGKMASSTLRSRILQHALPHVPEHSFTIQPLLQSLRSLPSTTPSNSSEPALGSPPASVSRNTIDILFGSELNARKELVKAWEEEGLRDMTDLNSSGRPATATRSKGELGVIADLLARRLEYSSRIGEHLVEVRQGFRVILPFCLE
jgi:ubiquinone biosynthesis protein COQ9